MNKSGEANRSVRNTRRRLREGLLRLMEEKPINEISVKELTELADVNRGTFYFHYADIYDLLRRTEEEFFDQFSRTLSETTPSEKTAYPYLHAVFAFLGDNRDFCSIMLGPHGDMQFVEQIKRLVDQRCSYFWREAAPEADERRFGMYNAFIINGCIGIIQKWLSEDASRSPEEISQLAATIILSSVRPGITQE